MTIGQEAAAEFIESKIKAGEQFGWRDLSDFVKTRATVKNWLTIRSILQWFLNQGLVARFPDVHNETYVVVAK